MKFSRCFLPALGLAAMLALHAPAQAEENIFEISMDELVENKWGDQVIARGNVEIRFFGEIVVADEVIYDRATRKLSARGHVTFTQADGTVTRSSTLNLHDDARDAFVAYARRQKMRIDR
jgi:LPS-assembly protein